MGGLLGGKPKARGPSAAELKAQREERGRLKSERERAERESEAARRERLGEQQARAGRQRGRLSLITGSELGVIDTLG